MRNVDNLTETALHLFRPLLENPTYILDIPIYFVLLSTI